MIVCDNADNKGAQAAKESLKKPVERISNRSGSTRDHFAYDDLVASRAYPIANESKNENGKKVQSFATGTPRNCFKEEG